VLPAECLPLESEGAILMEIRDQLAMAALSGLLAAPDLNMQFIAQQGEGDARLGLAMEAYKYADAMIAASTK
jgi:hypothetical protein